MRYELRAEWTKALTLPVVWVTLAAGFLVPPVLAVAAGLGFDGSAAPSFPPESHGFETAGFGQPIVILLAALITGTEYSEGQIRATLLASPRRGRVLAAKLVIIGVLAAATGVIATTLAVSLRRVVLEHRGVFLGDVTAGMVWNIGGVAINYALIALMAGALAILTRSLVVTLVVLVPLVLGLTISLLGVLPAVKFLPDLAGLQLLTQYPGVGLLDAVPGGLVMAAWALLLCVAAWLSLRLRDA